MTQHPSAPPGLGFFWQAARNPPAEPSTSYMGKTILITGANTGLGFEAAYKFAALGASTLILGVRSLEKGKEAKLHIERATKCESSVIQLVQLDMSGFDPVEKFVKDVNIEFKKIDVVVLNAGVAVSEYNLSSNNWEMSLQVNVLSTAYLAILLLPKLRAAASETGRPSHLEFVASMGHAYVAAESVLPTDSEGVLTKVNGRNKFSIFKQYQISKLLEMWAMRQISARISAREVVVVATCPGLCRSNLGRDFGLLMQVSNSLFQKIFARSSEEGSRTIVSATALGGDAHGGFWMNDEIATPGFLVTSEEGKKISSQFWEETLDILRQVNPDVDTILTG